MLLEEKEKYRKGLELELKKIKSDISDVCRYVDEQIQDLLTYPSPDCPTVVADILPTTPTHPKQLRRNSLHQEDKHWETKHSEMPEGINVSKNINTTRKENQKNNRNSENGVLTRTMGWVLWDQYQTTQTLKIQLCWPCQPE